MSYASHPQKITLHKFELTLKIISMDWETNKAHGAISFIRSQTKQLHLFLLITDIYVDEATIYIPFHDMLTHAVRLVHCVPRHPAGVSWDRLTPPRDHA